MFAPVFSVGPGQTSHCPCGFGTYVSTCNSVCMLVAKQQRVMASCSSGYCSTHHCVLNCVGYCRAMIGDTLSQRALNDSSSVCKKDSMLGHLCGVCKDGCGKHHVLYAVPSTHVSRYFFYMSFCTFLFCFFLNCDRQ